MRGRSADRAFAPSLGRRAVAAAAFTNTARYVSRPIGPVVAGALMQNATGAPFFIAGGVKIVYDLLIYAAFRRVELPET